jgi:antibiotic biosynthesis monooxygenase (ABM) superfamily enzyme
MIVDPSRIVVRTSVVCSVVVRASPSDMLRERSVVVRNWVVVAVSVSTTRDGRSTVVVLLSVLVMVAGNSQYLNDLPNLANHLLVLVETAIVVPVILRYWV